MRTHSSRGAARCTLAPLALLVLVAGCGGGTSHPDGHGGHGEGDALLGSTPMARFSGDAVWVVNGGDASVSVIDVAALEVRGTIALHGVRFPHHVYFSPAGDFAMVADPGMDFSMGHTHTPMPGMKGALLKLDGLDGATLATRWLDLMNHNGAVSHDGREVWTTEMHVPGAVLALDAQTLQTLARVPTGESSTEVTFSPDGARAFVGNGLSSTVSVIDVATRARLADVPAGKDPVGAWPGRDGRMYVDAEQGRSLTVIEPQSLQVVRALQLPFIPGMATATSAGEVWVTDSEGGRVVVYGPTGAEPIAALATGPGAHGLVLTPDEATLFVSNQAGASVSVVDVAGRTVRKTLAVGNKPNGLAFRRAR